MKGTTNNPNGRPLGKANKVTTEIRECYQNLISENLEQLKEDLKELEPLQRLKIIIELSKFVVPVLKATELTTVNESSFIPITVNLLDESEIKDIINKLKAEY